VAESTNSMMSPPVEELLDRAGSKFSLVTLGARRARDINTYYNQLGDALGTVVPPQVTSTARKPLSIAFEEIDADKIEGVGGATGKEIPESLRRVTEVEGELGLEEALPTGPVEAED
jgi:DNA-directed RNA polymerase subunit omega